MSLPDLDPARSRAIILTLFAVFAVVLLAACNVRPLYGSIDGSSGLQAELTRIDVAPVEGRIGQQVRNELLFLLNGGNPAGSDYVVELSVRHSYSNIIVRRIGGQPQGRTVNVQATFRLRQPGVEAPLFGGRVTRHASYERSNQRFANDRAEIDAENRAAAEVSEEIRIRLASFFASGGAVSQQDSPDIQPALEDLTAIPGDTVPTGAEDMMQSPGAADLPGIN